VKKNILSWVLRIVISLGLFALLFTRFVDPKQVVAELAGVSVTWLLVALLVQAGAIYSSIWRWQVLLRGQGLLIPHRHLVSTFLIGRFFGTFLPSTIGLDAYRTFDVARRAKATTEALAVLAVEKLIGFFALSTLVLVTLPAGLGYLPIQVLGFIFLVFCVPVTISFTLLLEPRLVMRLLDLPFPFKKKLEGKLRQAADAVAIYRSQKRLLLLAVLCGISVHLCTTLVYYCTARAINAPVALYDVLFVGPLIITATVGLPSIGGEGVREFTAVGLLARIGVSESSAFVLGHLGFWAGMVISLAGGFIYALRPASYRPIIQSVRREQASLTTASQPNPTRPLSLVESGE
jgi:uncharacterized protein (TIRG00374 family)